MQSPNERHRNGPSWLAIRVLVCTPERMMRDELRGALHGARSSAGVMYLPPGAAIGEGHAEKKAAVVLEWIKQL